MNMIKTIILTASVCLVHSVPSFGQQSLYQDVKANEVGDILTILLSENISGSATSDSRNSSSADGSASGSVAGNFLPFQPTFGADANVDFNSDQIELASQHQLLEGFMSVRIVEITPSGDLVVEGNRMTEINGELHELSLSGLVRPNDIDSRNRVLSYRIANANISYQKKGGLREVTKQRGLIKRIVLTGIGAALGAVIVMKSLD
jgi:flagellar L-ring protein precursor FlgH